MAFAILSFLVTTPEAWIHSATSAINGFPFLAGAGRRVVKDLIMLRAIFVTLADSAKRHLRGHPQI